MEPQTAQSQPPKKSRKRLFVIAVGVLIVLCLCVAIAGSLGGGDKDTSGTAAQPTAQPIVEQKALLSNTVAAIAPTTKPAQPANTPTPIPPTDTPAPPTDTPMPTATPTLKQLVIEAIGDRNRSGVPETVVESDADSIAIIFPINDNLKNDWILSQAQDDILNAARVIHQATGNAYDLTFNGTFSMQDAYGNVSESPVMRAQLTRATLDKINWDNLLAVKLPQVADDYWQSPAFSQ